MNLIDGWMLYLTKHLRKIKMIDDNIELLNQISGLNNSLEKLGKTSKKSSNIEGLIWLSILGYNIYLEFFK